MFLLRQRMGTAADAYVATGPDGALGSNQQAIWEVLVRPGKRLKPGSGAIVDFCDAEGNVACPPRSSTGPSDSGRGERIARLTTTRPSLDEALHAVGHLRCRLHQALRRR